MLVRRFATCLALAAAFAFALDVALASHRHDGATDSGVHYHGTHVHFHVHEPADATHHDHAGTESADHASHDHGPVQPGPDAGACCCASTCHAGVMLPTAILQSEPRPLTGKVVGLDRDHSS